MKRAILFGRLLFHSRNLHRCKPRPANAARSERENAVLSSLRSLVAISIAVVICAAGIGVTWAAQAQTSAPTSRGTSAHPQVKGSNPAPKSSKAPPKPVAPTPPKVEPEVPYPEIPEAPNTLELTGKTLISQGDSWTYLLSSSNPQMDGRLLHVALTRRDATSATLTLSGDGVAQREVPLAWNGSGWFSPVTDANGNIGIKLFWQRPAGWTAQGPSKGGAEAKVTPEQIAQYEDMLQRLPLSAEQREALQQELKQKREALKSTEDEEADAARILNFPIKLEAGHYTSFNVGGRWEQNFRTGVTKRWPGSDLEITGPKMCVVPAGAFASGVFSYTGPSSRMIACFEAALPVAVRARSLPEGGAGWLLFELQSYVTAETSKLPQFPDLPAAERQKALDWIRGKVTPGKRYDPTASMLFGLQEAVRSHPREIVRIFISRGITNDDKGYVVEWKTWKFSVREMTAQEASAEPRESMKTQIAPRETPAPSAR
jgi:hypothetical protein